MDREPREQLERRERRDQVLDADDPGSLRGGRELGEPELGEPEAVQEERKEQARQEYIRAGFSPRTFEEDWPTIRARLAVEEIVRQEAMADPELDGPAPNRGGMRGRSRDFREWRGASWVAAVIIILVLLWFWWIAIWGFGAWGTGANRTGQQIPQNQPVQQAPQNQR